MSTTTTPRSPINTTQLPPLVPNELDRLFLRELRQYIDKELHETQGSDRRQRFIVFSTAFSKVIEHVHAYKPLLSRIKKEYEDIISTIERGKLEAEYLNDRIQTMVQEPSTLRNYRRRADELSKRIAVIKEDNERLKKELIELREAKSKSETIEKQAALGGKRQPAKDSKLIPSNKKSKFAPGLTLEEATDIPSLHRELNKINGQINELQASKKSKFMDRLQKDDLKERLTKKVAERDLLLQRNSWLIARQKRLKIAYDAAMSYMNNKDAHYRTISDVIIMALANGKISQDEHKTMLMKDISSAHFEDDDPTKEKEAEMILDYIEKFNELFEDRRYEEAAIHAANSPKGILRTMETMARFKTVTAANGGRSPWLAFCDALMSSVLALGVKPSDTLSVECVTCALKENRLDLLSHWIAQERLTVTEKLGDLISDHCKGKNRTYLDMAEAIYRSCYSHRKVVDVMVRQGLYKRALNYAKEREFSAADLIDVLQKYPSYQLGYALCEAKTVKGAQILTCGAVCRALIACGSEEMALQILQKFLLEESGSENGLKLAVFNDAITTPSQWHELVKIAHEYGYEEVAIELLAAVTVNKAMSLAREQSGLSEKSSSELNFSSAASSRFQPDYPPDTA